MSDIEHSVITIDVIKSFFLIDMNAKLERIKMTFRKTSTKHKALHHGGSNKQ